MPAEASGSSAGRTVDGRRDEGAARVSLFHMGQSKT